MLIAVAILFLFDMASAAVMIPGFVYGTLLIIGLVLWLLLMAVESV